MNLRGESAVKGLAVDELAVPESAVIGLAISEPVTAHAAPEPEPAVTEAALDELVVAKPVVVFVQDENVPIMRDIDDNTKKNTWNWKVQLIVPCLSQSKIHQIILEEKDNENYQERTKSRRIILKIFVKLISHEKDFYRELSM